MSHIHTAPGQYDFSVGAFIVLKDQGAEPRLWLHWHKTHDKWMHFGGHVELDESPWRAVIRETQEELGYEVEQLDILQPRLRIRYVTGTILNPMPLEIISHPILLSDGTRHFHTDIGFAFVTDQPPRLKPAEGESSRLRTFTASEITAIPIGEIAEDVREVALFILSDILGNWDEVTSSDFAI